MVATASPKASIAGAPSAIAETIQLAVQPVTLNEELKNIGPVDRPIIDIIDAECIFIEFLDETVQERDDIDEPDTTDER